MKSLRGACVRAGSKKCGGKREGSGRDEGGQDAMCLWGMGWGFWRLWGKMGLKFQGAAWGAGGRCFLRGEGRRMFWKSVIG